MKYMRLESSFGGVWESNDKECLPFRIDGLAYVYPENGKWFASIDMESRNNYGPFDTMQDAINCADSTLRFQYPRLLPADKDTVARNGLRAALRWLYERTTTIDHIKNGIKEDGWSEQYGSDIHAIRYACRVFGVDVS